MHRKRLSCGFFIKLSLATTLLLLYPTPSLGSSRQCVQCASGKYSSVIGAGSCLDCGANLVTVGLGSNEEAACVAAAGYYKQGTAGVACPANTVSLQGATSQTDCTCAPGFFGPNGGPCAACPAGSYCLGGTAATTCPDANDGSASGSDELADCKCNAGYYGPDGGTTCQQCPDDTFCLGGELTQACPDLQHESSAGSDEQEDCTCKAGYVGLDGGVCNECPAGSYCLGGSSATACPGPTTSDAGASAETDCMCVEGYTGSVNACAACDAGTYKDEVGPQDCTACPLHSTSPGQSDALLDCICKAGYTGLDGQPCSACDTGTYKDQTGDGACQTCTGDSLSGQAAASADDCLCDPGFTGTGSTQCTGCAAGTYKTGAGSGACLSCPADSHSQAESDAQTDCACNTGFSGVDGGTCTLCPEGQYCTPGEAGPTNCPDDSRTPSTGASLVSECLCELGYSGTIATIADQCQQCPDNTFNDQHGGECQSCPEFSLSPAGSTAETQCLCAPGATGADGGPCTQCGDGFYKTGSGTAACQACPSAPHQTSLPGSTAAADCRCKAGYSGADGGACYACNPNHYKDTVGDSACEVCPDFTNSPVASTALSACECIDGYVGVAGQECGKDCPPGFQPGPEDLRCVGCLPGTYKPDWGDEACTPCPAHSDHYFYNQTAQTACDCVVGFVINDAALQESPPRVQCDTCPSGTFGNFNFENICHDCFATVSGACVSFSGGDNTHCPGLCQVPAGYEVMPSGNNIVQCEAGEYSPGGAQLSCLACATGSHSTEVGSTAIAACLCQPGFSRSSVDVACAKCGANTYKTSTDTAGAGGNGPCAACPANAVSLEASDALLDCRCPAGYTGADGAACAACPEDTFKEGVGSAACQQCPTHASSLEASTSAAACACDPGFSGGSGPCTACPIGSFNLVVGALTCTSCGPNAVTASEASDQRDDCVCDTGYEAHPLNGGPALPTGSCVPTCALGQAYSDDAGACVPCLAGLYKAAVGAQACSECGSPRNASAVGSDEAADCTCRAGEMGLFGPMVSVITSLGDLSLPKEHPGSPTGLAAGAHRLKSVAFTSMAGAQVSVTVAHEGTTLTLFECEPRDCADTTVELFGLRGALSVVVASGTPAWTVAVWEGRDWVVGSVHDESSLTPSTHANAEPGSELATLWADTVQRISTIIVRDSLSVGDHLFVLSDGVAAYHTHPADGEPYQLVCAPCPPGVVCGPPVAFP